jgi:hypothetical protein
MSVNELCGYFALPAVGAQMDYRYAPRTWYSSCSRFDDAAALILPESAPSLASPTWRATILAPSESTRKLTLGRARFFLKELFYE